MCQDNDTNTSENKTESSHSNPTVGFNPRASIPRYECEFGNGVREPGMGEGQESTERERPNDT